MALDPRLVAGLPSNLRRLVSSVEAKAKASPRRTIAEAAAQDSWTPTPFVTDVGGPGARKTKTQIQVVQPPPAGLEVIPPPPGDLSNDIVSGPLTPIPGSDMSPLVNPYSLSGGYTPPITSQGAYGGTGIGGISIGPSGISASGTLFGVPISGTLPFGGGSKSEPVGNSLVAPTGGGSGECPGLMSVKDPITGQCINLDALPPGGKPAMTGAYTPGGYADGYGAAVKGYFGVGLVPRVEVQTVRRCPPGTALGKDGICYDGLSRNSPKRMWPMGMKPLMTGGDRAAIARAARVARKLEGAKKSIKKAGKALERVC